MVLSFMGDDRLGGVRGRWVHEQGDPLILLVARTEGFGTSSAIRSKRALARYIALRQQHGDGFRCLVVQ